MLAEKLPHRLLQFRLIQLLFQRSARLTPQFPEWFHGRPRWSAHPVMRVRFRSFIPRPEYCLLRQLCESSQPDRAQWRLALSPRSPVPEHSSAARSPAIQVTKTRPWTRARRPVAPAVAEPAGPLAAALASSAVLISSSVRDPQESARSPRSPVAA